MSRWCQQAARAVAALALGVGPAISGAAAQDQSEVPDASVALSRVFGGVLSPTPAIEAWAGWREGEALVEPQPARRALDPDGALFRRDLRDGRRLGVSGRCKEALPTLARAALASHDDGRAAVELARCARLAGELETALEAAALGARRAAGARRLRAMALYELGRAWEGRGVADAAEVAYVESLSLRASPIVSARLARVGDGGASSRIDQRVLDAGAAPCADAGARACRVTWQEMLPGGGAFAIVALETEPRELVEIEGSMTIEVSGGEVVWSLHVLDGGRWSVDELGRWWSGDGGSGGTGGGVEVLSARLVDAVRGGHSELALELRVHDIDYDWCESYWHLEHSTRVYGLDGGHAVLWADLSTSRARFVAPGRIAWVDAPDPDGDRSLDEEWESCGLERSPRTPEEWSAARLEGSLPEPRFSLRFANGVMSIGGVAPPSLAAVTDVPRLAGVTLP